MKRLFFLTMTVLLAVIVMSMSAQTLMVTRAFCDQIISCFELDLCDCDEPQIIPGKACYDFNGRSVQIAYCGTIGPPNLCTTGVYITCP